MLFPDVDVQIKRYIYFSQLFSVLNFISLFSSSPDLSFVCLYVPFFACVLFGLIVTFNALVIAICL